MSGLGSWELGVGGGGMLISILDFYEELGNNVCLAIEKRKKGMVIASKAERRREMASGIIGGLDFGRVFDGNLTHEVKERNSKRQKVGCWTPKEDDALLAAEWSEIALSMPNRTGKQCSERWNNHLDPKLIKGRLTPDEVLKVVELKKTNLSYRKIGEEIGGEETRHSD